MLHENHANRKRKKKMLNGNINAKALTSRNIIRGITEIYGFWTLEIYKMLIP
jgi:hypothetical protein